MIPIELLYYLHGWYHVAVRRYDDGDVTAFLKNVYKHSGCNSHVRLFLLISVIVKMAITASERLLLVPSQM